MHFLVSGLILLFCLPAFFVEARFLKAIVALAVLAFVGGALALTWATCWIPADFLTAHPELADTPLHPTVATALGGILVLFGLGLALALGTRVLYRHLRIIKD
jgi:hypothetical protein